MKKVLIYCNEFDKNVLKESDFDFVLKLDIDKFANGELQLKLQIEDIDIQNSEIYLFQRFSSENINNQILSTILFLNSLKVYKPQKIVLLRPYFPYSRKDREDDDKNTLDTVSCKSLLSVLEFSWVDEIFTVNIHNPIVKWFSNILIHNIDFIELIKNEFKPWNVIISPDFGSVKNNFKLSQKIACEHYIVQKIRNEKNKTHMFNILHNWILNFDWKEIYIYDDMIDTGSTLCNVLDFIINNYQNYKLIKILFTHPILSWNAVENLNKYSNKKVEYITANTYISKYQEINNIKTLSVKDLFQTWKN